MGLARVSLLDKGAVNPEHLQKLRQADRQGKQQAPRCLAS